MTYTVPIFNTENKLGVDLATSGVQTITTSTPEYPGPNITIGTQTEISKNGVVLYCTAASAITQYDAVLVSTAFSATSLTNAVAATASIGGIVGVATQTLTTGQYGWIQTGGITTINITAPATAYAQLHSNAATGTLSVLATGASYKINGVVITTTVATGTTTGNAILASPALVSTAD